jgi:tetratricopeptide (TPR) repeat protein
LSSDNPNDQNDFASTFNMFAHYYKSQKKFIEAIAMANKAINITDKLLASDNKHKYLIYWIRRKCSLAEIYFDANQIESAKSILSEIKPQAEKCLVENSDDNFTKYVNNNINELLEKINQRQ